MKTATLRQHSRHLLGTMYRLEVASTLAAWPTTTVNATALSKATGITYPRVHQEMNRLAEAGLLKRGRGRQTTSVDYSIGESVYWSLAADLRSELEGRGR